MSSASKRLLSPEEYLEQERRADFRSEYLRGEVFAMAGASYEHTLIKDNLAREAGNQLEGHSVPGVDQRHARQDRGHGPLHLSGYRDPMR